MSTYSMKKQSLNVSLAIVSSYLLWIVSDLIGIGVALAARDLLVKLYIWLLKPSPWTIEAIDKMLVIAVILGWIVLTILCERYYVGGAREGKLLRRFALVTIPSLAVLGIGYALGSFT
jgi:hypothetical protein